MLVCANPTSKPSIAFVALGSNLGDRAENLNRALESISSFAKILNTSSFFDNPAIDIETADDFLNAVIKIETALDPQALLLELQNIEKAIDPEREKRGRKISRILDLDLLLYGDCFSRDAAISLPHPRMFQRDFVLKPLLEIEPEFFHNFLPVLIDEYLETLNYKVRRMQLEDLDGVMLIEPQAFGKAHWTRNLFAQELSNPNALYLVAESFSDHKILGYTGAWAVLDEVHIMTLAVDVEARRRKIAETLMLVLLHSFIESKLLHATLEVRVSNIPAHQLYEKYSFQRLGTRKNYYEDNHEAGYIYWTENMQELKFLSNFAQRILDLLFSPKLTGSAS